MALLLPFGQKSSGVTPCHVEYPQLGFNFDIKNFRIFSGPKDTQFGYTVQQHEAGGRQWRGSLVAEKKIDSSQILPPELVSVCHLRGGSLGRLLVGAPFESTGNLQTGDIYKCPLDTNDSENCSRLNLGELSLDNVSERKDKMRLGMTLTSNPKDNSFVVGVVQYSSTVVHEFNLGEYQTVEDVVEAARSIDQRGGEETRTALGISVTRSEAFQRGGRPGAQKVMIVITDGESHDSPQLMEAVSDSKKDNITMYAIAVLGYYNRRGINPEAFLKEIKFIASDPDEKHFFEVTDETGLKNIVDALGEQIFSLEGTDSHGQGFGLQMAQAGFSSHLVKDGVLLGAVGAFEWNGAVLKETKHGKVVPPKSSYQDEFPEALKNHAAYLGYSVGSLISSRGLQLYVAGAPRFNHTGKVIIFTLKNSGNLTILHALLGVQIGSYFGSELLSMDIDSDGHTDFLLVAAPMYYSQGWERGRVYIYSLTPQTSFVLQGILEVSDRSQNSRLGSALDQIADMNGDGFRELAVGAPLEDDHQGAVYIFYSQDKVIQLHYKQRLSAAGFSTGLQYFGQSLHGVLDINADGLIDLAVGALGAAVIIWSRDVVRIHAKLTFEPEKVNIFNKDYQRGGKDVTCMSVTVCLSLHPRIKNKTKTNTDVALLYTLILDEHRFPPRAILDESDRQQPRSLLLQSGSQKCQRLGFSVQETADYGRPIVVVMETVLQNQDKGPVLDPDWPSIWRAELNFWNGCEREDTCMPDLILHSHTDLVNIHQFCSSREEVAYSLCSNQVEREDTVYVVETGRKRMVVFAQLENQGENAYKTAIHISTSLNLLFSSLLVKDQSDVQIECYTDIRMGTQRSCNISAPFMKSMSKITFHLEFEFNHSTFLDHAQVVMITTSEGMERHPEDNTNDIFLPLKYQTDLLFTRDPNPPRFEIRSYSALSWDQPDSKFPTFNLTYNIQNLGIFSVQDILFRVDIWALTRQGYQLVDITDYSIDEAVAESYCTLPHPQITNLVTPEDLSHLSQLNHSNSASMVVHCRLSLLSSQDAELTLTGRLQLPILHAVNFRSLELLIAASVQLEASSPMFLREGRLIREIILDLSKEEDDSISIWIILGSSLGGLMLLSLLILVLLKLGFFNRRRRQETE
ncbi:integrin alpha-11 [Leuresthes tenuis]|uniref:integrin alpha-11 n=1 Tax=Leuresthes tenuis TaxID=355514 RepID=UPI003B507882